MLTLHKIERFLKVHDMPQTKFGRLEVNDPRLIGDLRNGRDLRSATRARVEAFMSRAAGQ
jgi:hypothetical protein